MNHKIEEYTDGWAYIYEKKEKGNKNIDSLEELKFIHKIAFKEKNARGEDYVFAEGLGHSLNKKVKVQNVKFIKEKQFIKIGTILYYLYRKDIDKLNNELYLYLESFRDFS